MASRLTAVIAKRFVFACCLSFVTVAGASAECVPPRYRIGFRDLPSEAYAQISIAMNDFSPRRLVCLGTALKRRYRDRRSMSMVLTRACSYRALRDSLAARISRAVFSRSTRCLMESF
jgi:hypothetical protein